MALATKGISPSIPTVIAGTQKAALEASGGVALKGLTNVPVDNIRVIEGFNPRIANDGHVAKVAELMGRIDREGFLPTKPLAGFAGKDGEKDVIYIYDGHTRLEATRKLNETRAAQAEPTPGIDNLPVVLIPTPADMEAFMQKRTIGLVTENSGDKLDTLEQAIVVRRLIKSGMKVPEVALALAFSDKWVNQLMMLVNGPKTIRDLVRSGKMKGSEAIRLMLAKRKPILGEDGKKVKGKFDYAPAEEEITKVVKRAEDAGKTKASRKDTDEGTKGGTETAGVKMSVNSIVFEGTKGTKLAYADISRFATLMEDQSWFKKTNDAGTKAMLLEDVKINIKFSRPKKEGEVAPDKKEEGAPETEGGEGQEAEGTEPVADVANVAEPADTSDL